MARMIERGDSPALPPIFLQQRHSIIGKLGRNERFDGPLRERPGKLARRGFFGHLRRFRRPPGMSALPPIATADDERRNDEKCHKRTCEAVYGKLARRNRPDWSRPT